jgi:hypothetical protein
MIIDQCPLLFISWFSSLVPESYSKLPSFQRVHHTKLKTVSNNRLVTEREM